MTKSTYTVEEFKQAVKTSFSISQVLIKLGKSPKGGNYRVFKDFISKHNIDVSHFTGQGWNKGNSPNIYQDRKTEDYLNNVYKIQSNELRKLLLREKYFSHMCYKCLLKKWNDLPIPLELEHIDGNPLNNKLENLTLLCPNCHAQTDTYRGKNKNSLARIRTETPGGSSA